MDLIVQDCILQKYLAMKRNVKRVSVESVHSHLSDVPSEPFKYLEIKKSKQRKEGVVDYAEHCSTHGIFYIFERNASTLSHLFW